MKSCIIHSTLSGLATAIVATSAMLASGCASYHVNREFFESSKLEKLKKSGIIVRIPRNNVMKMEDYSRDLQFWLKSCKMQNNLKLFTKSEGPIFYAANDLERFYQMSSDEDFLLYKSLGVIKQIVHENEAGLKGMMSREGLDSLIIYEIDGDFSTEMQYIDFNSLVTIVDADLEVLFLDHQATTANIDEFDPGRAKSILLDEVSKRLIQTLEDLDYLELD